MLPPSETTLMEVYSVQAEKRTSSTCKAGVDDSRFGDLILLVFLWN